MKKFLFYIYVISSTINILAMEVEKQYIAILTNNGVRLEIARDLALQSPTLRNEIENFTGDDAELELRAIDSDTFSAIQKLLELQLTNQLIDKTLLSRMLASENILLNLEKIKKIILGLQYLDCTRLIEIIIEILCKEINLLQDHDKQEIIKKLSEDGLIHEFYIDKLNMQRSISLKRKRDEENNKTANKKRKTFDSNEIAARLNNFKNTAYADKIKKLHEKFNNIKKKVGFVCPSLFELTLKCIFSNLDKDPEEFLAQFLSVIPGDETDLFENIKEIINKPISNDPKGSTRLHLARSPNQVMNLLQLGANPLQRDFEQKNAFIRMIERKDTNAAQTLFELTDQKNDLMNQADNQGNIATHYLAMINDQDLFKLIETDFHLPTLWMRKNNQNEDSLIIAVKHGNLNMIPQRCINRDNIFDVLITCIKEDQTKIFIELLPSVEILFSQNNDQVTWMHTIFFIKSAEYGRLKIFESLLSKNIVINHEDAEYPSALKLASIYGNLEIVKLLLAHPQFQVNMHNQGNLALFLAIRSKSREIALFILTKSEVTVNTRDRLGKTVLMDSIAFGYDEIAKALLKRADTQINSASLIGETALTLAAERGNKEIVQILLDRRDLDIKLHEQGSRALLFAVVNRHKDIAEILLNQLLVNVNHKDNFGRTALQIAVQNKNHDITKLLLGQSDVDINSQDKDGYTCLMDACVSGDQELVQLLLNQKNIDVNMQDHNKCFALTWSALYGHIEIVKMLLNHPNINVNLCDKEGRSAVAYAKNNLKIIQMLQNKMNQQKQLNNK